MTTTQNQQWASLPGEDTSQRGMEELFSQVLSSRRRILLPMLRHEQTAEEHKARAREATESALTLRRHLAETDSYVDKAWVLFQKSWPTKAWHEETVVAFTEGMTIEGLLFQAVQHSKSPILERVLEYERTAEEYITRAREETEVALELKYDLARIDTALCQLAALFVRSSPTTETAPHEKTESIPPLTKPIPF